ncbi:hypothetical protein R50073_38600 [Maricurvus nonylphenolicus]
MNYLIYGAGNGPFQIAPAFSDSNGTDSSYSDTFDEQIARGFITDFIYELLREENVKITPVVEPIKRMKRDILAGQFKPWITYGFRGWEAMPGWEGFHFLPQNLFEYTLSQVYYGDFVKPASTFSEFKDCRVILIRGFSYQMVVEKLQEHGALVVYADNFAQALRMLKYGRAEIFLGFDKRVKYVLQEMGLADDPFHLSPFMHGQLKGYATLMMSDDIPQPMVDRLTDRVQAMIDSGRWQALWDRY